MYHSYQKDESSLPELQKASLRVENVIVTWTIKQGNEGIDALRTSTSGTWEIAWSRNEIMMIYTDNTCITRAAVEVYNTNWHTQCIWQCSNVHVVTFFAHRFHWWLAKLRQNRYINWELQDFMHSLSNFLKYMKLDFYHDEFDTEKYQITD